MQKFDLVIKSNCLNVIKGDLHVSKQKRSVSYYKKKINYNSLLMEVAQPVYEKHE